MVVEFAFNGQAFKQNNPIADPIEARLQDFRDEFFWVSHVWAPPPGMETPLFLLGLSRTCAFYHENSISSCCLPRMRAP